MMKTKVKVKICNDQFLLRSVEEKDAEILRNWKNEHKEYFFFKKEISKDDQLIWFNTFYERQNDFMFIIEDKNQPIGCIGARLYQESIDIYNVILGDKNYKGKHVMKNALWATVSFCNLVYYSKPVRVRVLTTNPAREWYEKIGFNIIDYYDDHVVMQFRKEKITENYRFSLEIDLPLNNSI